MTTDWNAAEDDGFSEAMFPGTGNDGESTIMPGICTDDFEGPCEGPNPLYVLVGTAMGVPDGIFGDDRAVVVIGVDKLDPGDKGERGVAGSPKDILNCETLEGFGFGARVMSFSGGDVFASPLLRGSSADVVPDLGESAEPEGRMGPTFTSSPFFSISSTSCEAGSSSSSLSPSSPPTRLSSSSLPNRTALFSVEDCEAGRMDAPRDEDGREEVRSALNRDTGGFGGEDARFASSGTT